MYKIILIMVFILGLSFLMAHPPGEMYISFDNDEMVLTVVIEHNVGNPENHYVDQINITHERRELIVHKMSRQDDGERVTLKYRLPDVQSGMTLTIVAGCNRIGRLNKTFEIE